MMKRRRETRVEVTCDLKKPFWTLISSVFKRGGSLSSPQRPFRFVITATGMHNIPATSADNDMIGRGLL